MSITHQPKTSTHNLHFVTSSHTAIFSAIVCTQLYKIIKFLRWYHWVKWWLKIKFKQFWIRLYSRQSGTSCLLDNFLGIQSTGNNELERGMEKSSIFTTFVGFFTNPWYSSRNTPGGNLSYPRLIFNLSMRKGTNSGNLSLVKLIKLLLMAPNANIAASLIGHCVDTFFPCRTGTAKNFIRQAFT